MAARHQKLSTELDDFIALPFVELENNNA